MTSLFIALACLVSGSEVSQSEAAAKPEPRRFHEIDKDIQTAFRQEALAKTPDVRAAAVRQLVELHREIVGDSRYFTSDVLKEYRGKVASRLMKVKQELKAKIAREQKRGGKTVDPANATDAAEPADSPLADEATATFGSQLALVGYSSGGPVQFLLPSGRTAGGAAGGGVVGDFGPDLVDLIQRTISPRFWDVNGGPGTIVYYRPLYCLVVRATGEIHGQVGDLADGLRAAGK